MWHPSTDIDTTVDGERYVGRYRIEDGMITVGLVGGGIKTTHLGGSSATALAGMLLRELIDEERRLVQPAPKLP